jgi:hypothetical protein
MVEVKRIVEPGPLSVMLGVWLTWTPEAWTRPHIRAPVISPIPMNVKMFFFIVSP